MLRNFGQVDGTDGSGALLRQKQVVDALRTYGKSLVFGDDIEELSQQIGIDIEGFAKGLISVASPFKTRHVINIRLKK